MALGSSMRPCGDYRTSYAGDTTIFETPLVRNITIVFILLLLCAPLVCNRYLLNLAIQIGYYGIAKMKGGQYSMIGSDQLQYTGSAINRGMSSGESFHFESGLRRSTPRPVHGTSRRTRSAEFSSRLITLAESMRRVSTRSTPARLARVRNSSSFPW